METNHGHGERTNELNEMYAARGDIYRGDWNHEHQWAWKSDDGNGHMGYVCACGAYRP